MKERQAKFSRMRGTLDHSPSCPPISRMSLRASSSWPVMDKASIRMMADLSRCTGSAPGTSVVAAAVSRSIMGSKSPMKEK